jgi:peptidoglycan/LPS O-acetylase OafA/YrhL
MTLNDALIRKNNNFDVLRLIAACMVIIGHAHALVPNAAPVDFVQSLLHFDYAGSLAVKFFFFLSGLVVTNSLLEKPGMVAFAVARTCRLMPALIVCVILSALVLGPMVTLLPVTHYLADPGTWSYITANVSLYLQWELPGVFTGHRNTGVNGSLWTLPIELFCYTVLAALGLLGLLRNRLIGSTILVAVIVWAVLVPTWLSMFGFNGTEPQLPPACFAFGGLLALNKHAIQLRFRTLAGLLVCCVVFRGTGLFQFTFYAALFYGSILAAVTPLLIRTRMPGDFSYGVYLYGFPLQQLIVSLFPHWSTHQNQIAALAAALIAACCSWYLVEQPGIRLGRMMTLWPMRFGELPAPGMAGD